MEADRLLEELVTLDRGLQTLTRSLELIRNREVSSALRHRKRRREKRRPQATQTQIIAANLRDLRKEAGLSQRVVALDVGVSHRILINHEKGRAGMRQSTLKAYADYYAKKLGREITVPYLSTA